jgi:DNA-binding transcriptional MerR regulator
MNQFLLLGDVARTLRVPPHRIVYLFSSGQLQEPAMRLGSRRIFTFADMLRVADKLQIQFAQEAQAKDQGGNDDS